ncbi:MAG: CopG family transcriptional regulator [Acidimicrobiaceae bacterium]|nr:CopG family transcriptional regulator [Acidimicrobiaceae bacterium]MXW74583.1 CopG family transcriptional regulator [Acidimicrobiaceae bacterium]MYC43554.1 CopG family transcriptional regulator [Acidimicrobiaceae bacterium]MYD05422.1 CopG family transcriptional regulator [Acidimicrobiaceae bacterium]MYH87183.1 CopG family transcriptional regulator [Acidimicrobiaceae bacterium]
MPVVSIRFSEVPLHKRLKDSAARRRLAISTLAERLIDEGLRMEAHPGVMFREGPTGRRAVLVGGPEVSDVIASMIGGDVPVTDRRARTAELMGLSLPTVDAALAYYADHTEEVDTEIAARDRAASEAEAAWRRQRTLLTK